MQKYRLSTGGLRDTKRKKDRNTYFGGGLSGKGLRTRALAFCIALMLPVTALPAYAVDEKESMVLHESFAAVNLKTGSTEEDLTAGGFSCTVTLPEGAATVKTETHEESVSADEVIPVDEIVRESDENTLPGSARLQTPLGNSYTVGESTRTAFNRSGTAMTMKCLAAGKSCTVWGCMDEDEAVRLTETTAQQIAAQFDDYQQITEKAFGDAYDVDGDGKLAIYCYDIDENYPVWTGAFTSGFFRPYDLLRGDDAATDCIHLDTFPGMSWPNQPLANPAGSYTTLVHEYQHLINQSVSDADGREDMELYLNEAFSMAAEHMICGSDSTYNRVHWFNVAENYVQGVSLCCWCGGVASYSNAYLFGQYLRTRYKQMNVPGDDGNGNTLFKRIMQERGDDTLAYLADLFYTTSEDLLCDFWEAVYRKEASGIHGFAGEAWADEIQTQRTVLDTAGSFSCSDIYNGGARFFSVPDGATVEITKTGNVRIIPLGAQGNAFTVTEKTCSKFSVSVYAQQAGSLGLILFDERGRMLGYQQKQIGNGSSYVTFSALQAEPTNYRWKLIFFDAALSPICWENPQEGQIR